MWKTIRNTLIEEEKRDLTFVIISGIALLLSLTNALGGVLSFDIAWVAIALCGILIVVGSAAAVIQEHDIKADVLVSIALVASLYIGECFAAGEVTFIMAIGTLLEGVTARKTRKRIEKLIHLTPKTARIRQNGEMTLIPAERAKAGDILVVFAGETIACDGVITAGETTTDQSVMARESIPTDRMADDEVISGTINQFDTFEMRATKNGSDNSLQRTTRLAEEVDANKAPIVRLADHWTTWLVVAVFDIARATWLFTGELIHAVTVLIVSCPCAFILTTPTATMAGIGNTARFGILVCSGEALQRFSEIDSVAFDKTGTLTYDRPAVTGVKSFDPTLFADELLRLTALTKQHPEHPLGKAILAEYLRRDGKAHGVQDFALTGGMGVHVFAEGRRILAGRADFLKREGTPLPPASHKDTNDFLEQGTTVAYVSIDGVFAGFPALADSLQPIVKGLIGELKAAGIHSILLTGDNEAMARHIVAQAGLEEIKPNLLSEEESKAIQVYRSAGRTIYVIGDGVNDTLALETAFVGITMGGIDSDTAVETADAVFVGDNIERIPHLFRMARKSMKRINFNIAVAMTWNVIVVFLSAAGVLSPIAAALVHNVGSVFVMISSALLITNRDR